MTDTASSSDVEVILIAPNVSEQMGGEAIKALQIYLELDKQGVAIHQIVPAAGAGTPSVAREAAEFAVTSVIRSIQSGGERTGLRLGDGRGIAVEVCGEACCQGTGHVVPAGGDA